MAEARIGIIGGSGLYQMEGLGEVHEVDIDTPFGKPSDCIVVGELEGVKVAFLPRHGRGHRISPTRLPVRANVYALKCLGVERIISISAVGSLREELRPLDLVVPGQLIDRTRQRVGTFFEDGIVAHVGFSDPFCPVLGDALYSGAQTAGAVVHQGGTYVVMEGPAFSSRAESEMYRSWGADIIGMTALPEAKLAREAEICYAILACVTDYDCWHEGEEAVTVDMVVGNLVKNTAMAREILRTVVSQVPAERSCACSTALRESIITSRDYIDAGQVEKLGPLVAKYLS